MPKAATGELRTLADGFAARITIKGRERRDFLLPTCATEDEARARCTALAGLAARLRRGGYFAEMDDLLAMGAKARAGKPWEFVVGAVDAICGGKRPKDAALAPTFKAWAADWTSGEIARRHPDHVREKRSASRDEELLEQYIIPHVGDVRVDVFELEDAERVMAAIPATSERTKRPLSTGSRRHIAQVMARLMRLAVYPGKHRASSPIPPGWLPRQGDPKAKECLFPDEDALLLGGRSVEQGQWGPKADVPLLRRLAYGFLAREGMRCDEMASLRWRDVDLERGRVVLDANKTDDPRDWDLRPDVVEALARWKARQTAGTEPGDPVFAEDGIPLPALHLADRLRVDLRRVGVTRPQLFERTAVRQPIRAHDLRATFVTVSLATGKTETWVSDRTGHQSHEMVDAYRRKARTWNQGELGPLHELIPELSDGTIAPRIPHAAFLPDNSQRAQRKPMP